MMTHGFIRTAILVSFVSFFSGCCSIHCNDGCGVVGGCGMGGMSYVGNSCGGCGSCGSCTSILHGELAARVRNHVVGGCSSGCGEVYCDESINEPRTCDPCGPCGEFTGDSCCACPPLLERLRILWGTPYIGSCDPCGAVSTGCSSCNSCSSSSNAVYSSRGHEGGYCPSCRDGGAGIPQEQYSAPQRHAMPKPAAPRMPANNAPMNAQPKAAEPVAPIPDPNPDARVRSNSVKARPVSTASRRVPAEYEEQSSAPVRTSSAPRSSKPRLVTPSR